MPRYRGGTTEQVRISPRLSEQERERLRSLEILPQDLIDLTEGL